MVIAKRAVEKIKEKFPDKILEESNFRDEFTVRVERSAICEICQFLKDDDELQFDMVIDVCGLDRYNPTGELRKGGYVNDPYDRSLRTREERVEENERFEVIYHLYSNTNREYIRLKVRTGDGLKVPSVVPVWVGANWHERETYDMFGVEFDGHPDLRRIYMPEYFDYFPLRKDFPLLGIPGSLPLPDKQ